MNDKVSLLRALVSTVTPTINWSYEFRNYATNEGKDIDRRKDPAIIHTNPKDNTIFYLSGRFEGYGSVVKF